MGFEGDRDGCSIVISYGSSTPYKDLQEGSGRPTKALLVRVRVCVWGGGGREGMHHCVKHSFMTRIRVKHQKYYT